MSFPPPGPPMPMPGMPPVPPMMPPPYHPVPPMVLFSGGMIPMTVGMMPAPMMAPVAMAVPPTLPLPPHPKSPMKKHLPPMPYKRHEWMNKLREYNKKGFSTGLQSQAPKGPPVTVFVGNITERASDSLIRQILQRCGTVVNWKRVQGANGKLQAFGFCEYGDPESGLRAIRLLHDWQVGEKKLVVKVDAKTKEKLDEYKATKWANQNKDAAATATTAAAGATENNEDKKAEETDDKSDEIDENTKKEDLLIKSSIEDILRDHSVELSRPVESKATDIVEPENHLGWLNSFSDKRILKSYQLRKLFTLSQNNNTTTNKESPPAEKPRKSTTKPQETQSKSREDNTREPRNDLDEMDLEEEKKSLIHREIDKFRDTYKRAEEEKEKEKERERKERDSSRDSSRSSRHREYRDKERKSSSSSSSRRERTPVRERDRDLERTRERERERERTRSPVERSRGKDKIERLMARSRSRSRDRAWSQERERSRESLKIFRSRDKDIDKDREDEEDAYDRKKMDRKLREKEAAYQERLRNWEQRERRKAKDYEKTRQKEDDQKQEELKEARRLKEFLEDYDDERDDPKYYKGSALARRLKEREKEIEADNHDRRKEKEELEELRRQLVEKGHPDPDGELERLHQEEQAKLLQPKAKAEPSDSEGEPEPPAHLPKMKPIVKQEVIEEETKPAPTKHPLEDESTQNSLSGFSDVITTQEEAKPLGFGVLRLGGSPAQVTRSPSTTTNNTTTNSTQNGQKKKISLQDVFNDDDSGEQRKKRKLIPLDDVLEEEESAKLAGSSQQNMSLDEKRKHIKNLIDKIPTAKEELFAFTLDWSLVDKPLMERKIKPWINKKIVEYIGEEEPTLVDFICSKVLAGSAAQSILDDVSMVLDEEAEVFVVKMWRLLIYEIEAKKLGLMR